MQPVEAAGGEEARHRVGAAFDQDPAEAALGERGEDGGRRELPVGGGKRHDFDAGRQIAAACPRR